MAATDIKLIRKKTNKEDILGNAETINLTTSYIEKKFPLTDSNGDPIPSDAPNAANTGYLPQYYEFNITIPLPSPIPSDATAKRQMIDDLIEEADLRAKRHAQKRANLILDYDKVDNIIKVLNQNTGIIFEGTFTETYQAASLKSPAKPAKPSKQKT